MRKKYAAITAIAWYCYFGSHSIVASFKATARRHGCDKISLSAHARGCGVLLNQKILRKKIIECRGDVHAALDLLGSAYPHFRVNDLDASTSLIDSLIVDESHEAYESAGTEVVVDGKCIAATMEVLRRSNRVDLALKLLRLAAFYTARNRSYNRSGKQDDGQMRRIYKSVISLLGDNTDDGANKSELIL